MRNFQQPVETGFAKAARRLGSRADHYRILDPLLPLGNKIGTTHICFDAEAGFQMHRPRMWGNPMAYALCDARGLCIGDLFRQGKVFHFVSAMEACRPPLCVACSAQISVSGMRGAPRLLVDGCPASLVLAGKGEDRHSGMPGAVRAGSYMMHMPVLPGFCLMPYMQVTDDHAFRYLVESVELSAHGIRALLSLQQV